MNEPNNNANGECCPKFYPERWEGKTVVWDKKPFIKSSVPTFFHIPSRAILGKRINKMVNMAISARKLSTKAEEVLLLFFDPHPFKSEMYLSVTGEVPQAENTTLSGRFITKVFDGPYRDTPKFFKQMDAFLNKQNIKAEKYYMHYAYCPKCAQKEGHNYMLVFAELANSKVPEKEVLANAE